MLGSSRVKEMIAWGSKCSNASPLAFSWWVACLAVYLGRVMVGGIASLGRFLAHIWWGGWQWYYTSLKLEAVKVINIATYKVYAWLWGALSGNTIAAHPLGMSSMQRRWGENAKINLHKSIVYVKPYKGYEDPPRWRPRGGRLELRPGLQRVKF